MTHNIILEQNKNTNYDTLYLSTNSNDIILVDKIGAVDAGNNVGLALLELKQSIPEVATVIQGTPTLSINSAGLIKAEVVQQEGLVTEGTKSVTKQLDIRSAKSYTPTTTSQTIPAQVYLTGEQTIIGDTNLIASNIKKDKTIFGVNGTLALQGDVVVPSLSVTIINNSSVGVGIYLAYMNGKAENNKFTMEPGYIGTRTYNLYGGTSKTVDIPYPSHLYVFSTGYTGTANLVVTCSPTGAIKGGGTSGSFGRLGQCGVVANINSGYSSITLTCRHSG